MNKQKVYELLLEKSYNKVISKEQAKEALRNSEFGKDLVTNSDCETLWDDLEHSEFLVHNSRFILLA